MTGYIYRQNWDREKLEWSEEQLVTPYPITADSIEEVVENTKPDYGRFEICSAGYADTAFVLRDIDNKIIDFVLCRELLPWE